MPWGNNKRSNIFIIRVLKGEEKKYGTNRIFEAIMAQNFPNMVEEKNIQETKQTTNRINLKKFTQNINNLSKTKDERKRKPSKKPEKKISLKQHQFKRIIHCECCI